MNTLTKEQVWAKTRPARAAYMTDQQWHYLKRHAERTGERFLRCNGVTYEVRRESFETGPSPQYTIVPVVPVQIPDFVPDQDWE